MKKKCLLLLVFSLFIFSFANAQQTNVSSMKKLPTEKSLKHRTENKTSLINKHVKVKNVASENVGERIVKTTRVDPITQFPWTEGFEAETLPPAGWSMIDNDGDGINWDSQLVAGDGITWANIEGRNSVHAMGSASFRNDVGALSPDNWLITPPLNIPNTGNYALKYWVGAVDGSYYNDHYEVMISTTGTNIGDFTTVFEETLTTATWSERTISLASYLGQTIYIAFVHNESHDVYIMRIDDISVLAAASVDAEVVSITSPVSGINLTNAESVTAVIKNNGSAAITGFTLELEVNGVTKATESYSGTIAAGAEDEYMFTTTADLSAAGDYTIKVTANLTSDEVADNNSKTITVTNTICGAITSLPLTENFEAASHLCWTAIQGSSAPVNEFGITVLEGYTGSASWLFSSYNTPEDGIYDQYLISPELPVTTDVKAISFYYKDFLGYGNESFRIGYSTSDNSIESFTWLEEMITAADEEWHSYVMGNISGNAKYIAINYTSDWLYYLFIDDITIMEFANYFDAAIANISSPNSGANLTSSEAVTVTVRNNSSDPISNFTLTLTVDGTVIATETYTGSIASLTEVDYTFTATADLSAVKDYLIKVSVTIANDEVPGNNTLEKTVANYGDVIIMGSTPSVTVCNKRFLDDGGSGDYTYGESQIITFYPETAGDMIQISFNELVTAIDPLFGTYDALFILNGAFTMDDLENLVNEDVLGGYAGDYTGELPEPIMAENEDGALTVYFEMGNLLGLVASGWDADIACVTLLDNDLAVTGITPTYAVEGKTVTPKVMVRNVGLNPASNWTVTLSDGNSYTSTKSGSQINFGETVAVSMDNWNPTAASTLTATVTFAEDENTSNNTMAVNIPYGKYLEAYTTNVYQSEGFLSLDLTTGATSYLGTIGSSAFAVGEDYDGNYIYRVFNDATIGIVLPNGDFNLLGTISGLSTTIVGLSYDWTNKYWYLNTMFTEDGGTTYYPELYTLNMNTLEATLVGRSTTTDFLRGLDMANDDYLYSVSTQTSMLVKINPKTGECTSAGATGLTIGYAQDVSFDEKTKQLYTIAFNSGDGNQYAALGTYNINTGAFTEIYNYGLDQFATVVITNTPEGYDSIDDITLSNNKGSMVYPNPSAGPVNVDVIEKSTIRVFDFSGKLVQAQAADANSTSTINLRSGIYMIQVDGANNKATHKVIIK